MPGLGVEEGKVDELKNETLKKLALKDNVNTKSGNQSPIKPEVPSPIVTKEPSKPNSPVEEAEVEASLKPFDDVEPPIVCLASRRHLAKGGSATRQLPWQAAGPMGRGGSVWQDRSIPHYNIPVLHRVGMALSATAFLAAHFVTVAKVANRSNRKTVSCKYCNSLPIENRDSRPILHIRDCLQADADTRSKARQILMLKGAIKASEAILPPSESPGSTGVTDVLAASTSTDVVIPVKKRDLHNISSFTVHANLSFRASMDPYLGAFMEIVRPSYSVPSPNVMTTTLMQAERSRVEEEDIAILSSAKCITLLFDGWEDNAKRALYGVVAAQMSKPPIVLTLKDLTGHRGSADKHMETILSTQKEGGLGDKPKNAICLTTDDLTVMRSFRNKYQQCFYWVLTLACFLHGLNTLVGRITAFPDIKPIITKCAWIVSYFNSSHYWGGQLKLEAQQDKITRKLQMKTETRWYSLVLQGMSLLAHKGPLIQLCTRTESDGYTPIAADVVAIVGDPFFWRKLQQLIKVCKPTVDAIGDLETRDANLADCMLTFIRIARDMMCLEIKPGESVEFWLHAKTVFNRDFHAMNTDLHILGLFLHPRCRKLAISESAKGRSLKQICKIAMKVALQWRWDVARASLLVDNIKQYHKHARPFNSNSHDALDWWESLGLAPEQYPIKTLAIRILSIVPHAAEVERLFADLGGVQGVHRCNLTVPNFETLAKLRSNYKRAIFERAKAQGKSTRRRHAHMHTRDAPGIDVNLVEDIKANFTFESPDSGSTNPVNLENESPLRGLEDITEEEIEAAYGDLAREKPNPTQTIMEREGRSINVDEAFDMAEFERIEKGEADSMVENNIIEVDPSTGEQIWSIESILASKGL
ncbi:hypothetical protein NMY22_g18775 [Coprinellus aureogranulatus]|nr:hypothetical protein NMY22_g18775 [Coprinellus aureogranulatus]